MLDQNRHPYFNLKLLNFCPAHDEINSIPGLTCIQASRNTTTDPQLARFFKFDWNNNPVSIAIDEIIQSFNSGKLSDKSEWHTVKWMKENNIK